MRSARELLAADRLDEAEAVVKRLALRPPADAQTEEQVMRLRTTLCQKLSDRARQRMMHTQYSAARQVAKRALVFAVDTQSIRQLLDEIDRRSQAPETAELSGLWRAPTGAVLVFKGDERQICVALHHRIGSFEGV